MNADTKPKVEVTVFSDRAAPVATGYTTEEQARHVDRGIPLRRPARRFTQAEIDAADIAASNAAMADPIRIPHEDVMRELGW